MNIDTCIPKGGEGLAERPAWVLPKGIRVLAIGPDGKETYYDDILNETLHEWPMTFQHDHRLRLQYRAVVDQTTRAWLAYLDAGEAGKKAMVASAVARPSVFPEPGDSGSESDDDYSGIVEAALRVAKRQ